MNILLYLYMALAPIQKKYISFFLGIAAFLVIILFTDLEPGKPEVTTTLAITALMAIWWVTETIPLAVTALVPLVLFLLLAFLWITRAGITFSKVSIPGWAQLFKTPDYINDGTVAVFISIILFLVPAGKDRKERIMNWKTAQGIPWNIVLLFGGGFALALGFQSSGLAIWFGEQLLWTKGVHPYLILLAVVALMSFLTELTSNVASTQMLLPVFASLAHSLKIRSHETTSLTDYRHLLRHCHGPSRKCGGGLYPRDFLSRRF